MPEFAYIYILETCRDTSDRVYILERVVCVYIYIYICINDMELVVSTNHIY
jgi:hypothetical protein